MYAHIVSGSVADYPYYLRAIDGGHSERCAKRLYPQAYPLPGTWEQCSAEQLAAVNAVPVVAVERPAGAQEITPTLVGGVWMQTWAERPAYDPTTHDVSWDGTQWITSLIPLRAVSKYQLRAALREQGRLQAFNTYITYLADGTFVREKWENGSGMFGFNKPWCDAVKAGLGLTAAQMRALWRSAQAVNEDE